MSQAKPLDSEMFEDPLHNYEPNEYPTELHRVLAEQTVAEIQSRPFVQISDSTPIRDAIQTMHGLSVSSLLVVRDAELVGIFTERDVLEKISEQFDRLASRPVSEFMTTDPTVVYETDPSAAAVAAIAIAGHRHVPMLKIDGTLGGIVSPLRVIHFFEGILGSDTPPVPR